MTKREHNDKTFGGYLYTLRKEREIGFDEFRLYLGVSKAYLNDVETDSCRPPTPEIQTKMLKYICQKKALKEQEISRFYSLAALRRGELPADVLQFLISNAAALDEIRATQGYKTFWQNEGI